MRHTMMMRDLHRLYIEGEEYLVSEDIKNPNSKLFGQIRDWFNLTSSDNDLEVFRATYLEDWKKLVLFADRYEFVKYLNCLKDYFFDLTNVNLIHTQCKFTFEFECVFLKQDFAGIH